MSSVVASARLGPYLLPPPPPPPPPPISSSVSPVSARSASPDLGTPTNYLAKQPVVKPTTAGLLRFPSLPDSNEQLLTCRSLSPQFKQELLAKQSALAPTTNDATTISIEDKIRQNKMMINNNNRQYQYGASNGQQQQFQQQQQVPDKLMSAMQKETKPFAYTLSVSDPNNRGKLDLSQIKSPIMRRRLLANMSSSTEEREFEEDDDSNSSVRYDDDDDIDDQDVIFRSETISPEFGGSSSRAKQQSKNSPQKTISFSPVVSFTYVDRDPMLMNSDPYTTATATTQVRQVQEESRRPIIRYNDAPKFYTRAPIVESSPRVDVVDNNNHHHHHRREQSAITMDRLDAEMAETLDDFERMLSDMSSTNQQQRSSTRQAPPFHHQAALPQAQRLYNQNQAQCCWPAAANGSNFNVQKNCWNCQDSAQTSNNCLSPCGQCKDERTSRSWLKTFQA